MSTPFHEFQVQFRVPLGNLSDSVENFRRQHGIINRAQ
jgi:hypothetical protein